MKLLSTYYNQNKRKWERYLPNQVEVRKIKKRKYNCNLCTRHFMNRHTLEFHINVKHRNENYSCHECSECIIEETFEDLYDYYRHSIDIHDFPTTIKYMEIQV